VGWNTWNDFKYAYNQSVIETVAEGLVSTGLSDAGYKYLVLDAGWQSLQRDSNNRQQANQTKFPDGIAALVDKIHKLGLKAGIYRRVMNGRSDAGIYDCGFYPGSYGYEELDAGTYASWGIDYLKYDNCGSFHGGILSPYDRFATMANALASSGREIFYSLCQWGQEFPWFWADQISESYRMSGDIHAEFLDNNKGVCETAYCLNTGYAGVSVLTMIRKMREISLFQAPGSWADMDMLEIGLANMTVHEEQTHMSFWSALKSPLIIGAAIDKLSNSSLEILRNREIIALNQDDLGVAVSYQPKISKEGSLQVWAGPLSRNRHVLLVFNEGASTTNFTMSWNSVKELNGRSYSVRDVWDAKNLGKMTDKMTLGSISTHQTKVL
ncbi:glycoside hydrolase superfamily, partial [Cadophora sp. MPI-SDFR-AT-0126]